MKNIKIEIKWAIIFLIVTFAWMFMEKLIGLHDQYIKHHEIITNLFAIPAIAIYAFALLNKRKKFYNGVMTYKQGFMSGLIITVILTILAPLTQYIVSVFITPDYFDQAIKYAVENRKMTLSEAQDYFNLKSYIVQNSIGTPVMGIITTAIVAFFCRTRN
ncbi:DUF4199 domain-containing protein [Albibacterium bauzanense]|uniref:Uncharacterized protein DUF4199 n=1 Tax=Albibacterium bauzanense TaxID=653929 RepID=A0A4R1M0I1_9SPHI|nr:DUF4199 domain-containing protein [Albibacterium bauzanense]TCK85398.1 uncharacterized protein DUF4199 [Albibacterium bauzanense]